MKIDVLVLGRTLASLGGGYRFFGRLLMQQVALDPQAIINTPQSSVILDKEGNELFRFFEQDRRWVTYEQIAPPMIAAIIAAEDEDFWTNPGIQLRALVRATLHNLHVRQGNAEQLQGGSTITQQLVKNIYLTNEKTLHRKVQEIVLAVRLTRARTRYYRQQGYSQVTARHLAKELIVTAYLNFVFFGNHAYGIDAAARQYFHTGAANLDRLQSTLLASLPQAPSLYNPTLNADQVMGERTVTTTSGTNASVTFHTSGTEFVRAVLREKPLHITTTNCLESLQQRATLALPHLTWNYQRGRKDRVACRLYKQKKITLPELKELFLSAQQIQFFKARFTIHAPHFVFRIQRYVLQGAFFAKHKLTFEQLSQGGYTIVTTLDSDLQIAAETALLETQAALTKLGGNNRSIVHIDTTNGNVRSYVGSTDFFDPSIDGQVDVLQSRRQVGSTLKPLIYSYLFMHYPVKLTTFISDYPLPKQPVKNHDNMFRGKTTIAKALGGSRNLPAVRLFFALGGSEVLVPYLRSLGLTDLDPDASYSYPLVLGAGPTTLMQLAQSYIQLSITGNTYPLINPILSITTNQGKTIYTKPATRFTKQIPDGVADMIRQILATSLYMPENWRRLHDKLPLQHIALKTGTSDIKAGKTAYPRDGLSIIYSPTDLIITRAGNTDGHPMGPKAFGGEINHATLKTYLDTALRLDKIVDQPRISNPNVTTGGVYAQVDHTSFTPRQKSYIRGGISD